MAREISSKSTGRTETQPNVDFGFVEALLPRLVLQPHADPRLGKTHRQNLARCMELCEEILKCKKDVEAVQTLLAGSERSGHNLLEEAFRTFIHQIPRCSGDVPGVLEFLTAVRKQHFQTLQEHVPADLVLWTSSWEQKIDVIVGEQSLNWLRDYGQKLAASSDSWRSEVSKVRNRGFSLGLRSRLRAFALASKARAEDRKLQAIRGELATARTRLAGVIQATVRACSLLGVFMKLPSVNCGSSPRRIQKLIHLNFERDIQQKLKEKMQTLELEWRQAHDEIVRRQEVAHQLRKQIAEMDAVKNLALVQHLTTTDRDASRMLSRATLNHMSFVYSDLEMQTAQEAESIAAKRSKIQRLRAEMERLAGVIHGHRGTKEASFQGFAPGERGTPGKDVEVPTLVSQGLDRSQEKGTR